MAFNLSGCLTCVKYSIFVFNFFFWMVGCALVGIGIWVIVDSQRFVQTYNTNISEDIKQSVGVIDEGIVKAAGIAIIVIGGAIMITGFLGCCGAIRESQVMLSLFFAVLFLIFAALVAIGVVALVKRDWVKDMLSKSLRLEGSYNPGNGTARGGNSLLAYGYRNYGCCGIDDLPTCDKAYPPFDKTPFPCDVGMTSCSVGCLNVLWGVMSQMAIGAGIAAVVAGVLLLTGMMFSMCLCCALRQR